MIAKFIMHVSLVNYTSIMKGIILVTILLVFQPLPNLADLSHVSESPIDRLSREVAELQSKMKEMEAENKELKSELTKLKNGQDCNAKDITRLDAEIGNNQMDVSLLQADVESNAVQINVLDTKIETNTKFIQNNTNVIGNNTNQIQINGDFIQNNKAIIENLHLAPIGSIVAWTPRAAIGQETIQLPVGWIRCNGQEIPSPSSWAGIRAPDLNSDRRFLRGGDDNQSLTFEDDMFQDHRHPDLGHKHEEKGEGHNHKFPGSTLFLGYEIGYEYSSGPHMARSADGDITNESKVDLEVSYAKIGDPNTGSHGSETRPKNMGVVWIMRIY